jgi:hypothetical protein
LTGLLGGAGRYCEYTGRYYCYECHVNEAAIIPARVLREWDFRPYRVCHAAKTLLDQLYYLPAFAILDVNPRLYATAPSLYDVRVCLYPSPLATAPFLITDLSVCARVGETRR